MKKIILTGFLLTIGFFSLNAQDLTNFELIFEDEFNYTSVEELKEKWLLNESKSLTSLYNDVYEEYREENISFENGQIVFTAEKKDDPILKVWAPTREKVLHYNSAMIQYNDATYGDCEGNRKLSGFGADDNFHGFSYGYYEAKITVRNRGGVYPAFWLLSPVNTEIDIFEYRGPNDHYGSGVIDWEVSPTNNNSTARFQDIPEFSEQQTEENATHIYGAMWTEEKVEFYFDGQKYGEVPYSEVATYREATSIILNFAVADYAGFEDAKMRVDYVRVYKDRSRETEITGSVVNITDEVVGGNLVVDNSILNLHGNNALELGYDFLIENGSTVNLEENATYGGLCPVKPYQWNVITSNPESYAPETGLNVKGRFNLKESSVYTVSKGSTHTINSMGTIFMENDSKIIVKEGGNLIIANNGTLSTSGTVQIENEGEIELYGTINIGNHSNFSMIGNGALKIQGAGGFKFGNNTSIDLSGAIGSNFSLDLGANVNLKLDANTTKISRCDISMSQNSKILLNENKDAQGVSGDYLFSYINIDGQNIGRNNEIKGIGVGNIKIEGSSFSNMKTGLQLLRPTGSLYTNYVTYAGCDVGIYMWSGTGIEHQIKRSEFKSNNIGLEVLGVSSMTLTTSNFSQCNIGISSNSTPTIYLEDQTKIYNCSTGITSIGTNIFVRSASQIDNNTIGVKMENHYLKHKRFSMGDDGTCGYLTNNGTGLYGKNILLDVDAEDHALANFGEDAKTVPNHFEGNNLMFNYIIEANGLYSPILEISAKGNYWGDYYTVGNSFNPIYKPFNPKAPLNRLQVYYVDVDNHLNVPYNINISQVCVRGSTSWCGICADYYPVINDPYGPRGLCDKAMILVPNPGDGRFKVRVNRNIDENDRIQVRNVQGILIEEKAVNPHKPTDFDISNQINGIYNITIICSEGVESLKYIKNQ